MRKTNKLITVICYNSIEFWKSREKALRFYKEAARYCDGCEAERYANIVFDLIDGKMLCEDGSSWNYSFLHSHNHYHQFPNGTNVRDYTGKIESPTDTYGICMELPDMWK